MDRKIRYNKLVRDKIPVIIQASGKRCIVRIAEKDERLCYIAKKLHEEAQELTSAITKEAVQEEIADVMQVLDTIALLFGITREEIETTKKTKNEKRGSFEKFIILEEVEK